jgi:hypothetical protein
VERTPVLPSHFYFQLEKFKRSSRPIDDDWSDEDEEDSQADKYDLPDPMLALRRGERPYMLLCCAACFLMHLIDELERQVREAQETVKQLRRAAPSAIHDAVGQQLASKSKDFEDILVTGVVDKTVPVRVRVPSDLCASKLAFFLPMLVPSDTACAAICDIAKAAKRLDKKCGMLKVVVCPVSLIFCSTHQCCFAGAVRVDRLRCRAAC